MRKSTSVAETGMILTLVNTILGKFLNMCNDLLETLLAVIDKIHLIYSKYDGLHQCTDSGMSSGL